MFTVTKTYRDLPAAHRQPHHKGHCSLIHGHNWAFDITFACSHRDENGFVLDVGEIKFVKEWLEEIFDHTLLLNTDDPWLPYFKGELHGFDEEIRERIQKGFAKIIVVPNCGMEGLARHVYEHVQALLEVNMKDDCRNRALRVLSVTCWEDSKNRATYKD